MAFDIPTSDWGPQLNGIYAGSIVFNAGFGTCIFSGCDGLERLRNMLQGYMFFSHFLPSTSYGDSRCTMRDDVSC
jgi:hypothetical protein